MNMYEVGLAVELTGAFIMRHGIEKVPEAQAAFSESTRRRFLERYQAERAKIDHWNRRLPINAEPARGQTLVEYAVLLFALVALAVTAWFQFGRHLNPAAIVFGDTSGHGGRVHIDPPPPPPPGPGE